MADFMERSWWLIIPAAVVAVGVALLVGVALVWVIPWYGLMSGFLIIGLIAIWLAVIYDLVRRADMAQWTKVIWAIFVVLIPIFGVLAYYLTRPSAAKIRYHGDQLV